MLNYFTEKRVEYKYTYISDLFQQYYLCIDSCIPYLVIYITRVYSIVGELACFVDEASIIVNLLHVSFANAM